MSFYVERAFVYLIESFFLMSHIGSFPYSHLILIHKISSIC